MIYKPIKTLVKSGISDIVIVLGGESVGDFIRLLGDGKCFGATFSYVYQQQAGGIAEALNLAKELVKGHKIAVILGDNIFEDTFKAVFDEFEKSNTYQNFLFLKEVENPRRFGVAEMNKDGLIKSIEEKPLKPKSKNAITGLYLYNEQIFKVIQDAITNIGYSERGELEITDVNNFYIKDGKTKAITVKGFWSDAGTFDTLIKSSLFIQSIKNKKNNKK